MRNGNLLKSRVSEIGIKLIGVNQGVGVDLVIFNYWETWLKLVMLEQVQACFI